jgi:hypothetical protein
MDLNPNDIGGEYRINFNLSDDGRLVLTFKDSTTSGMYSFSRVYERAGR